MEKAIIFDIQRFSVHDGPGIRTLVFFKGCPLNCQWCANPESKSFIPDLMFFPDKCIGCGRCISVCRANCIEEDEGVLNFDRAGCTGCMACTQVCSSKARVQSGKEMTSKDIIKEVDKDIIFYHTSNGGVTFSGGEAMCFPDSIIEIAKYYKEKGISTALETCGYVPWDNFEKVLPFLDLVLFDLKLMDCKKHLEYVGKSNRLILENLKKVCKLVQTIVRIPIIPTINDSEKDLKDFGEFLMTIKEDIVCVNLLPYHNLGVGKYNALGKPYLLNEIKVPSNDYMEKIKEQMELYGLKVRK